MMMPNPSNLKRQQQRQQQRASSPPAIFLLLLTLSLTIHSSYGWMIRTNTASSIKTTTPTAVFYKSSTSSVLVDDFPLMIEAEVAVATNNKLFLNRKYDRRNNKKHHHDHLLTTNTNTKTFVTGTLPWIVNNSEKKKNEDKDEDDTVFLSHWEWQLSYFKKHLTNFRINNNIYQDDDALMNIDQTSKKNGGGRQRIFTVSYTSEEYRDIRMTYMHLPGSQFFRCVCYPHSSQIPIMGMGLMKFGFGDGKGSVTNKHMAVMDYQPLPTTPPFIRSTFEAELRRIQSEIPTMNQPMSNSHFKKKKNPNKDGESCEEDDRKYFSTVPLIGKWDDTNDRDDDYHRSMELVRAQEEYVKTHIKLTQHEMQLPMTMLCNTNAKTNTNTNNSDSTNDSNNNNNNNNDVNDIIRIHSNFDTFVSLKEPAGKVLCSAFGKELSTVLVHRILFPLSRNLL